MLTPYQKTHIVDAAGNILDALGGGSGSIDAATETTLQQVCDRLDTIIGLLASALAPDGGFKVEPATRYIVQQTDLSSTWTIQSPIRYPQTSIYVTQIENNVLSQPTEAEAQEQFLNEFTIQITLTEPCKGFVVVN